MFEKFIDDLAKEKLGKNAYNQYSYDYHENEIRRNNLLLYFKEIEKLKPEILLCAEAPSYRGMRLTGIPFTSKKILKSGIEKFNLLGLEKGYKMPEEFPGVNAEPTATMIWETMTKLDIICLSWNAFPFHPFKKDNPQSNRLPYPEEITIGQKFLTDLINHFKIKEIVAVGNTASNTLNSLNLKSYKVRHPANGGKAEFVKGITEVVNEIR